MTAGLKRGYAEIYGGYERSPIRTVMTIQTAHHTSDT